MANRTDIAAFAALGFDIVPGLFGGWLIQAHGCNSAHGRALLTREERRMIWRALSGELA